MAPFLYSLWAEIDSLDIIFMLVIKLSYSFMQMWAPTYRHALILMENLIG